MKSLTALLLPLILFVGTLAQSPLITDPTNLAQFPSVEKLRAEMKGSDEADSYARFVAAADALAVMIQSLKRAKGMFYSSPPAAERIKDQYTDIWNKFTDIQSRPPVARSREFGAVVGKYQSDPGFLDNLLVKFFTPKFRADYYAWTEKPVPGAAAVDPAVAKARAASIDLKKLPSVDRIMSSIKGKDANDTIARQAAALQRAGGIIQETVMKRCTGCDPGALAKAYSQDENARMQQYQQAAVMVSIQLLSKDPTMNTKIVDYALSAEMLQELLQLSAPGFRDEYLSVFTDLDTRNLQNAEAAKGYSQAAAQARIREKLPPLIRDDGPNRKVARCIMSGRAESLCVADGLGDSIEKSLKSLPIVGDSMKKALAPKPPGPWIRGKYDGANGFFIRFGGGLAEFGCGEVKDADVPYDVSLKGSRLVVDFANYRGQHLALTVGADGRLSASRLTPAPATSINVTGQVQVGSQSGTRRTYVDGVPRDERITEYIFETRTRQCSLGILTLDPSAPSDAVEMTSQALSGTKSTHAKGLLMQGRYTGSDGLDLEFFPESVIVGCREAVIARPYEVSVVSNRVLIKIQHGTTPLTLELKPNYTLDGSGPVTVDGRIIIGAHGKVGKLDVGDLAISTNGLMFEPISDKCELGTLRPAPLM